MTRPAKFQINWRSVHHTICLFIRPERAFQFAGHPLLFTSGDCRVTHGVPRRPSCPCFVGLGSVPSSLGWTQPSLLPHTQGLNDRLGEPTQTRGRGHGHRKPIEGREEGHTPGLCWLRQGALKNLGLGHQRPARRAIISYNNGWNVYRWARQNQLPRYWIYSNHPWNSSQSCCFQCQPNRAFWNKERTKGLQKTWKVMILWWYDTWVSSAQFKGWYSD